MTEITKHLLREGIKEAKEKGQIGILIWGSWIIWDEVANELEQGNENYDFVLSQVTQGKDGRLGFEWAGLTMTGAIAVPVQKLDTSEEYFQKILDICEEENYAGPLTFLPSNETASVSEILS